MPDAFHKPAIQFTQSGRRCWTTTFTAEELRHLLPPRQPEQLLLLTDTNRPINQRHLNALARFLRDTNDWALPPLVLSATPDVITAKDGTISAPASALTTLGGQHRLQAFADLFDRLEVDTAPDPDRESAQLLASLRSQELSTTIIEVESTAQHRQIFAWFAKTRPIYTATREYFDNSDPYSKAAKTAMERSAILADRVVYAASSVPKRGEDSRKLLFLRNLKEMATVMDLGTAKAPRARDRELAWQPENQDRLVQALIDFFDTFLPSCTPNYDIMNDPQGLTARINAHRNQSWALHTNTLRLMTNCWARWTFDRRQDPAQQAPLVGSLKLRMADPGNDMQNALGLVSGPRLRFEKAHSPACQKATNHILSLPPAGEAQGERT